MAGALLDFGLLTYHVGRILRDAESGPYFYLSKVESAGEASLWDSIFTWTESQLGLPFGISFVVIPEYEMKTATEE